MANFKFKKLKNGLKVLFIPNCYFNSTCIRVYVGVGSRYEQEQERGFAHLTEHVLSQKAHNLLKLKDDWTDDPILDYFDCKTTDSYTCYSLEVHKSDLYKGINLMGNILTNYNLSAVNLKNEKEIIVNEIYEERDDFFCQTRKVFRENYYKNNNLKNSVLGNVNNVRRASKKLIQKFIKKYYQPSNIVLVVSGKIQDESNLLKLIRKNFKFQFPRQTTKNKFLKLKSPGKGVRIVYKQSKQLYLNYTKAFFVHDFATRIKWDVFVRVFKQYLFNHIRNKGFSYSLDVGLSDFEEFFNINIDIVLNKKRILNFTTIFKKYIQTFKNNFEDKSLKSVKEELIKSYDISKDYPTDKARLFGWQIIMFPSQELLSIKKIQEVIKRVSIKDITDCFDEFMRTDGFLLITGRLKNNEKIVDKLLED